MPWAIYKLELNNRFPSPDAEIAALAEVSAHNPGARPFLRLSRRDGPPGVGQQFMGCAIFLCKPNDQKDNLIVIASGRIVGGHLEIQPPHYMHELYGNEAANFLEIDALRPCVQPRTVTEMEVMTEPEVAKFLGGQAYCKYIDRPFPGYRGPGAA
jgi:hypothetical protein